MVIVAGHLQVPPQKRDTWVQAHDEIVVEARAQPGCLDLSISSDPLEPGRVNLYELWSSEGHLEAWRAIAQPPPKPEILSSTVHKHVIAFTVAAFEGSG